MSSIKTVLRLAYIELVRLVRSTKIIIFALLAIFINIQIISPLRGLSTEMGEKISFLEPFAALGNSGLVVIILPLFFIVMMADYPREGGVMYYYRIRCSKRTWAAGQVLYAVLSSALLVAAVCAVSALLASDFAELNINYSYTVTKYSYVYPENAGTYAAQLIQEQLYNQIPLAEAALDTALLFTLYFIMLALVILVFALVKKKMLGIFADGLIMVAGVVTNAAQVKSMWLFPMSHAITILHYSKYQSEPVVSPVLSYLYFGIADLLLAVLAVILSKRHNDV